MKNKYYVTFALVVIISIEKAKQPVLFITAQLPDNKMKT